MPKNKPSLISIHQMVVKVSFLSEKSAHDGSFSLYFSLKQLLHNFNNKNSFVRKSCWRGHRMSNQLTLVINLLDNVYLV